MDNRYALIDCGDGKKLEQFGEYLVIRPAPQAIWPAIQPSLWSSAHAEFIRTSGESGVWKRLTSTLASETGLPQQWQIRNEAGIVYTVVPNHFGNMGVFTEHWLYSEELPELFQKHSMILNLFTYSGSNCIGLAKQGYKITAVDSSKASMNLYTANLEANHIDRQGHKLVLEDCLKFIQREARRGKVYDSIMLDPPSYGRGTRGEVFAIEDHLTDLLRSCVAILSPRGVLTMTTHSPRFTPENLKIFVKQLIPKKTVEVRELLNPCQTHVSLPSGMLVIAR